MSKTKILFFFVFLLCAFWGLQQFNASMNTQDVDESGEVLANRLFDDLESIDKIVLSRPRYGNSVTLLRRAGAWSMTEPVVDEVSTNVMLLLLNELNGLRKTELPNNLSQQSTADLGLDTPNFVVEAIAIDSVSHTLLIGAQTVEGDFAVGQFDGATCLVPNSFVSLLSRSIDSWRDQRLSSLGGRLQKVEWTASDAQFSFVANKADNVWRFAEPFAGLFGLNASSLLDAALGARISSIGAPLNPDQTFGPKLGQMRLSGNGKEVMLDIYSGFVVSSERDYLLHVLPQRFVILQQLPMTLRSQRILEFNPQHLSAVVVRYRQQDYVFAKTSTGWHEKNTTVDFSNSIIVDLIDQVRLAQFSDSTKERPSRQADGMIAMSISRVPHIEKCPQLLWWVDANQQVWIGSKDSRQVYLSEVNFELGIKGILAIKH